ncbi:ImmA/IrrE family metallo-endopeptidase [Arthrobacter glacialis]|uniref:IrrE N-terminal-like domain-containing protein n=1 Tax=Arthrobacter glacialis TaxID=1664 RepID=A0A2S4A1I5_ARTGL|nr:ImmA/IrrE family metallo-endopeptidase [Arthrobacter glacialis]POH75365.1 hypothetical protein CVS27_01830 [Arthrobacter glacialis]
MNADIERVLSSQALASRFVQEHSLVPPVDVHALVAEYADILEQPILNSPDIDAVLLGLDSGDRRILLNGNRAPTRIRFTLAHELGHIALGWHIAHELVCEPEESDPTVLAPRDSRQGQATADRRRQEREANAFAARILVPAEFINAIRALPVPEMLVRLEDAQVSAYVGLRVLSEELPAGYVFALREKDDNRVECWWTSRTDVHSSHPYAVPGIRKGQAVDSSAMGHELQDSGWAHHQGRLVWWGKTRTTIEVPEGTSNWREIRDEILSEVCSSSDSKTSLMQSLGGVVGNLKPISQDIESIASELKMRLERKSANDGAGPMADFVAHDQFLPFVYAHARSTLENKKRKKPRRRTSDQQDGAGLSKSPGF